MGDGDDVGGLGGALQRFDAGISEYRDRIALVLVGIALFAAFHGVRQGTHGYAAVGVGLLLLARAVALGRPILGRHLLWSVACLFLAEAADSTGHLILSWTAVAGAGAVAGLPRRPPPPGDTAERRHVWTLVDATVGDALAPFALRTDKAYVFTADRSAAIAYRVRFGTAVASGDPVGDPAGRAEAVEAFLAHADANGWRVAALGVSDRSLELWRAQGLRAIAVGRDVILDVARFSLEGRRFRNLRQAVQRTRNAGVSTDVVAERELSEELRAELEAVMHGAAKNPQSRGFAMILDHVLDGTHPGTFVAYARDHTGAVVAFQRYATADAGRELSLDVPWRKRGAPNGVDERLIADVLAWSAEHGASRISLTFAAFPDLFGQQQRNIAQRIAYRGVRTLDRFIRLESLYRFVRKFHAFGEQRYVTLRPLQVVWVALALLTLEFGTVTGQSRRGRR